MSLIYTLRRSMRNILSASGPAPPLHTLECCHPRVRENTAMTWMQETVIHVPEAALATGTGVLAEASPLHVSAAAMTSSVYRRTPSSRSADLQTSIPQVAGMA